MVVSVELRKLMQYSASVLFFVLTLKISLVSGTKIDNRGGAKINGGALQKGDNFKNRASPFIKHLRVTNF